MERSGELAEKLAAARAGSLDALGDTLETLRAYLLAIAQRELDPKMQAKGGASDLVQETLIDALKHFRRFDGNTEEELRAWLRQLLVHNVVDFARQFRDAQKRQIGREIRLEAHSNSKQPHANLQALVPSPSALAVDQEEQDAIRKALERLPDDYRQVLLLRYREEQSFEEIGAKMQLTANAARKLWLRAVKKLQRESGDA